MENDELANRILTLEKKVESLSNTTQEVKVWQAQYGEKISNIQSETARLANLIEELNNTPKRNWNIVITTIISACAGAFIAFLFKGGVL